MHSCFVLFCCHIRSDAFYVLCKAFWIALLLRYDLLIRAISPTCMARTRPRTSSAPEDWHWHAAPSPRPERSCSHTALQQGSPGRDQWTMKWAAVQEKETSLKQDSWSDQLPVFNLTVDLSTLDARKSMMWWMNEEDDRLTFPNQPFPISWR